MITVHHLDNSRSLRVLWMLEELGLPYEIVRHARDPQTMLAPALLEHVHPLGKAPVVRDGDATLAESGAILEYLVETHGGGRFIPPAGTQAYRLYRYFLHYAEGSLMPYLLMALVFGRIRSAPLPFFVKPIAKKIVTQVHAQYLDPNLSRHLAFLTAHLSEHTWFAGDEFTAADVQMIYPLEGAVERAAHLKISPEITRYLERAHERPAYQRACAKA